MLRAPVTICLTWPNAAIDSALSPNFAFLRSSIRSSSLNFARNAVSNSVPEARMHASRKAERCGSPKTSADGASSDTTARSRSKAESDAASGEAG